MRLRMLLLILLATIIPIKSNVNDKRTVYTLMEVLKVNSTYQNIIDSTISTFKRVFPNITDEDIELCRKEINSLEFLDKIAPIYSSQFTEEEMKELITFYSTPTGKKALEKIPTLQKEFNIQVQNYQEEIVKKCSPILREKGYMR
jgi:hypothetical protein